MSIPDNYDQFEARERQQQKWLDSLPKCDHCGKQIQDEHFYLINNKFVCQCCLNRDFRKWTDDFIDQQREGTE